MLQHLKGDQKSIALIKTGRLNKKYKIRCILECFVKKVLALVIYLAF